MRTHNFLALGLTATVLFGLAMPTLAKPVVTEKNKSASIRVTIMADNDRDQTSVYQSWYSARLRQYDRIDPETGERLSDVLQMVVDINRDSLTVMDQTNLRRVVTVNNRTQILQPVTPGGRNEPYGLAKKNAVFPNTSLATVLREGDLVIVNGYLRANGGLVAQTIRLVGQDNRYDNDDYRAYDDRGWGEIREIDYRRGTLEMRNGQGPRYVRFDRDCEVMIDGKNVSTASLRTGDRVVYSFNDRATNDTVTAYRIVVLRDGDRYPSNDRPYWDDRDNRDTTGPVMTGRLETVFTGVMMNRLLLRASTGKEYSFYVPRTMKAIDRDGDRIALDDLRDGEYLRIVYNLINGNYFAQRVEIE